MTEYQLQFEQKDFKYPDSWIKVFEPALLDLDGLKTAMDYLKEHFPTEYRNFRIVSVEDVLNV